jgi:CBS domain-containing protein
LIREELLPIARHGLAKAGIKQKDIDHYLEIIEARNEMGRTGSCWMLSSFSHIAKEGVVRDEIISAITSSIYKQQHQGKPVHEWELASLDTVEYIPTSMMVEEFMNTDLITVQEDDILDLAANMMDWRGIRHLAVEDIKGKLVGIITMKQLLRYYTQKHISQQEEGVPTVKTIMEKNPKTIVPEDSIITVMDLMQNDNIGCLPVLKNQKLVGMITKAEFLNVAGNLVKRLARKEK